MSGKVILSVAASNSVMVMFFDTEQSLRNFFETEHPKFEVNHMDVEKWKSFKEENRLYHQFDFRYDAERGIFQIKREDEPVMINGRYQEPNPDRNDMLDPYIDQEIEDDTKTLRESLHFETRYVIKFNKKTGTCYAYDD